MGVLRLSWSDFDQAVDAISLFWANQGLVGVYGVPRGGLPLAVAVSHRLAVPLVDRPGPGVLHLDDIHDTGLTLWTLRAAHPDLGPVCVWVTRQTREQALDSGYGVVRADIGPDWVAFPWEDPRRAESDRHSYAVRRYVC